MDQPFTGQTSYKKDYPNHNLAKPPKNFPK